MKEIAVVIITYNRKKLLKQCLDSILSQKLLPDTIFIIDNNSSDGTYECLKENRYLENTNIQYHRLNTNMGGAGGFNYGMGLAYSQGYKWIWIMDDDVSADENCLYNLINISEQTHDLIYIPLRVSKINDNINIEEVAATTEYDITGAKTKMVRFKSVYGDINKLPQYIDVKSMSFEGPLISRKLIEKVGLPCKDFFIFYDDTDYSFRALKYTNIKLISSAILYRNNIIATNTNGSNKVCWRDYYLIRNGILFERRYSKSLIRCYIRPIYSYLRFLAGSIIKGRFSNIPLITKAYLDGYFNKWGKRIEPSDYPSK